VHEEKPKNIREATPHGLSPDDELESISKAPSLKISRIIFPIVIGLTVVSILAWKNFDPEAYDKISWGPDTAFWMTVGLAMIVLRHLAYSYRLWILSEGTRAPRTPWSAALGFFAAVPIAYLVLVVVVQVIKPLFA
jgi:hypothetical protein